ncbi:MAG TPA: flagellar hook-basal body complex protein [Beijerinckiaceae bacterium]|nr:flagellar hook-basal body complex protein [Beijerinckiaceae bacterium]
MGIFGAMTTAVSGLRAQSYALENISGNIANSQTTGFKRLDTSFVDLIPELPYRHELAGSVTAFSRLTNTIQGDLQSTGIPTNMALNGEGYFIVQERSGTANNRPIFGGGDLYTRRGDFALDKDGFLVNGAGYYLKGSSIDPVTGEVRGAGNGVIQISTDPLPARSTTEILYRANLPSSPATSSVTASAAGGGSATLTAPPASLPAGYDPRLFAPSATPPAVRMDDQGRFMSQSISGGAITVYNQVGAPIDVQLRWAKVESAGPSKATGTVDVSGAYTLGAGNDGNLTLNGTNIALVAADDDTAILSKINAQSAVTGVTASLDTANHLVLTAQDQTANMTVAGTGATLTSLGLTGSTSNPTTDVWNLFYLRNSKPIVGGDLTWQNVGVPVTFNASGQMTSATSIAVPDITIDGSAVGSMNFNFGGTGLTQFASASGLVQASTIQQDGYPSGTLDSVSVTSDGRISGNYSNGRVVPVAVLSVAQFNADNALKRRDGGVYEQTLEAGLPIIGLNGSNIIGGNVEGSNTDIAEEFSKMIVTQQAYSANTKVVSTSQQMLADVLNMIR